MKKNVKMSWLRTGIFLVIVIFAVICGDFLYTGAEESAPLEYAYSSKLLSDGVSLEQEFTPAYSYLTYLAIALRAPSEGPFSGNLNFSLKETASDKLLYSTTVSLVGVTDGWYLDFPVNLHLKTDKSYTLTLSAGDYKEGSGAPAVYLAQGSTSDIALRMTYNVLVPVRLTAFVVLLILVLTLQLVYVLFAEKKDRFFSINELLSKPFPGTMRKGKGTAIIHVLVFAAITLGAVILRLAFFSVKTNDYYIAYEVWINEIRGNGGLASLGLDIGDNPPLYMTLITLFSYLPFDAPVIVKLPSCIFDFILAVVGLKILKQFHIRNTVKQVTLYAVMLLNPLTLLDSAAWGQCDSLYTTFILLTILFLCRADICQDDSAAHAADWDRFRFSMGDKIGILFAVAIAFKLQAIFLLPVLGLVWIMQKKQCLKPVHLLWVPVIYTLTCIPMYLAGRDLKVMFKIYLGQADRNYGTLTLNYPNFYSLIGSSSAELYDNYYFLGLCMTFLVLILLFYQMYCRKVELTAVTLCKASAVSILIVCFFLPMIHERYAYAAEMLLLILVFTDVNYIKVTLPTVLCTLFTYATYLLQLEMSFNVLPEPVIALIRLAVICYMIRDILKEKIQPG